MSDKTGGPAFHIPANEYAGHGPEPGMTLRDYFAAKAMAAMMPIYWEAQDEYPDAEQMLKCHAASAYDYADAMLEARAK